jgi:hypothetical protein
MMTARYTILLPVIGVLLACGEHAATLTSRNAAGEPPSPVGTRRDSASGDATRPVTITRVETPKVLRGLYVNRWAALGKKIWQLIDVAKTTEVNALVIDVKDDRGFVLYKSRVQLAREIGADTTMPISQKRLRSILDTMAAYNIYPIARIVIAKDPLLAGKRLDFAIKRKDNLEPWLDKNGKPWLDPNHREIWQYAADLAKEAFDVGFSEVQFDYVRFPDEKRLVSEAVYPLAKGRLRAQVIREQLGFLRSTLAASHIPMTIDVFGLTATDTTDMGIGQRWEMFVDRADVVLPMVYPSHFAPGTYKLGNPNAHPYSTIDHALKDAKRRSSTVPGAAKVIPWYQDFTLGPPHYYAEHVRAQKKAGYDNGFQSWILWNPGSRYTISALERDSSSADGAK